MSKQSEQLRAPMIPADFVRVKDGKLVVGKDDSSFRFVGANSYILLVRLG